MGFGGFAEYVERVLGYKARSTQEKLRVAEALEELVGLALARKLHPSRARHLGLARARALSTVEGGADAAAKLFRSLVESAAAHR